MQPTNKGGQKSFKDLRKRVQSTVNFEEMTTELSGPHHEKVITKLWRRAKTQSLTTATSENGVV